MRRLRVLLTTVVSVSLLLAACQNDKGDPKQISRDFITSLWSGDTERVAALACKDEGWRAAMLQQAEQADPTVAIDAGHLVFEISAENDSQVEVMVTGTVTFKSADGQVLVRDLNEMGTSLFILVDESGWKVCDIR